MIAKLTGKLDSRFDSSIVVDVQGVGYALLCSQNTLRNLPDLGHGCALFVEPLIRQDAFTLFGFLTESERSLFRLLLTVQGVGGKVCLAILSVLTPSQVQTHILTQDHTPFTQAEGVGPKLAQRIIRELKDKVSGPIGKESENVVPLTPRSSAVHEEAISALVNLGYKKQEALEAVYRTVEKNADSISLNQLIPLALKQLTGA